MKVVSGVGEFEIRVESVEIRDSAMVMAGKMGVWESETFIEREEMGHLLYVSLRPRLIGWILWQPLAALLRRLRRLTGTG